MTKEPPSFWTGHASQNKIDTQIRYRNRSDGTTRVDGWAVHTSAGCITQVRVYQFVGRSQRSKKIWAFSDRKTTKSVVDLGVDAFPYLLNQRPSMVVIQVLTSDGRAASLTHDIG